MSDYDKPINELRGEMEPRRLSSAAIEAIREEAEYLFENDMMESLDELQDEARKMDGDKKYNYVADWFQHHVLCIRGDKKHGTDEAGDYLDSLKDDFVALKLMEARG